MGTGTGKRAVSAGVGSQCHLAQRLHSPSSCRMLWWRYQNLRGAAEGRGPGSGPGSPLSALSQLWQASGRSGAPTGSGPEKKSVDRVRRGHRGGKVKVRDKVGGWVKEKSEASWNFSNMLLQLSRGVAVRNIDFVSKLAVHEIISKESRGREKRSNFKT